MTGPADETLASPRGERLRGHAEHASQDSKTLEARPERSYGNGIGRGADPPDAPRRRAPVRTAWWRSTAPPRRARRLLTTRATGSRSRATRGLTRTSARRRSGRRWRWRRRARRRRKPRDASHARLARTPRRRRVFETRRALADDAKHAGSGFVLRETHIAETHIGAGLGLNPKPPGPGAGGEDPRRRGAAAAARARRVVSGARPAARPFQPDRGVRACVLLGAPGGEEEGKERHGRVSRGVSRGRRPNRRRNARAG